MRASWLALAAVLCLAPGTTIPAHGQADSGEPSAQAQSPLDLSEAGRWLSDAERYRGVCRNMAARQADAKFKIPAGSALLDFEGDRLFLGAIGRFCAFGDLIVSASDTKGNCVQRAKFAQHHLNLIRALSLLREESRRRVHLECVEIPGQLRFEGLEATSLTLREVRAVRLVILSSQLPGGIQIEDSEFKADILMSRLARTGPVTVRNTKILRRKDDNWKTSLDIVNSEVQSVSLSKTEVWAGLDLRGLTTAERVGFWNGTHIRGDIIAYGTNFGGNLIFAGSTVDGLANFDNANVSRLTSINTTFGAELSLRGANVRDAVALLDSTTVKGTFRTRGAKIGADVFIEKSGVEGDANLDNTDMSRIIVRNAKFGRDLNLTGSTTIGEMSISDGTTVKGAFKARSTRVGGLLLVTKSTFVGEADLDHLIADRVELNGAALKQRLTMQYAQIARRFFVESTPISGDVGARGARIGTALIFSKSKLGRNVWLEYVHSQRVDVLGAAIEGTLDIDHMRADAVRIEDSTIARNFTVRRATLGSLDIRKATIAPTDCKEANCYASLFNSDIGYFSVHESTFRRLSSGNARFRVILLAEGTTIGWLDCGDCLVEQFALIAARFTHSVNLAGSEVRGTLAFSENKDRARWAQEARLNLSELRADVIAADACDLMLEQEIDTRTVACAEQREAQRQFVPTSLIGARYRTVVPGRKLVFDAKSEQGPAESTVSAVPADSVASRGAAVATPLAGSASVALLDLPPQRIVDFIASSSPDAYNPQPYEEMADALTRSGKSLEAIEVRVARINDRLTKVETNPAIHAWYSLYYYVSYYGFKNWRAFLYFIGLIGIGAFIYHRGTRILPGKELPQQGHWLYSVWFSLDRAVPPLRLDPKLEEELNLTWWVRHYFYFHRVAGTVLISVFAAGLAGLGH